MAYKDINKQREAQRRYKLSEKGKITQAKYYASEAKKSASKRWRDKESNRIKVAAHRAVSYAIKLGQVAKMPCEECGVSNAFAHHDDYTKPLEVRWLCNFHHTEHHRNTQ